MQPSVSTSAHEQLYEKYGYRPFRFDVVGDFLVTVDANLAIAHWMLGNPDVAERHLAQALARALEHQERVHPLLCS